MRSAARHSNCAHSVPGAGLFVLSAWCLGILNSHGKFFLSYAAPVIWNAAIIAALSWQADGWGIASLAAFLRGPRCWAAPFWSPFSFPRCHRRRADCVCPSLSAWTTYEQWSGNFVPTFMSRGVVQISAYVDALLASLLPTGAVAALACGRRSTRCPSACSACRFGGGAAGDGERHRNAGEVAEQLRTRLDNGLRQIAFYIVPSAMAFAGTGASARRGVVPVRRVHPGRQLLRLGHSGRGLHSDSWRAPWAGSTPPVSMRCATPGHR